MYTGAGTWDQWPLIKTLLYVEVFRKMICWQSDSSKCALRSTVHYMYILHSISFILFRILQQVMIMWMESQFLLENQFLGKYKMQLLLNNFINFSLKK